MIEVFYRVSEGLFGGYDCRLMSLFDGEPLTDFVARQFATRVEAECYGFDCMVRYMF
jgi:hypothetical protein